VMPDQRLCVTPLLYYTRNIPEYWNESPLFTWFVHRS
jgi:hypothetical protein